jgi:hypothetical protein
MASRSCGAVIMVVVEEGDRVGGGGWRGRGKWLQKLLLAQFVFSSQAFSIPVSTTGRKRKDGLEKRNRSVKNGGMQQ